MILEDRVVLITGAGRRIGQAIALRLAGAGCPIALHYLNSRTEAEATAHDCRATGVRVELFHADLQDAGVCEQLIRDVLSNFGRLDVLVNNASVFEPMTLETFDLAAWQRTLQVNLTAPMVLAHAARDALRQAQGWVINLCDAATAHPWPDHLAYMVSKAGLETLTRALARTLAPEVNVVGVAPGVAAWPEHYDQRTRQRLLRKIPLQRAGTPEEIAAVVHFLLQDGDYITGSIVPVDGGRHLR